ncbi:MAG: hypothetical protein J0I33_00030 [Microbacterium ginsengisoli]|uniref:HicB-like antitoxin of toxin-antitoxin system domain-containing protein n=1 Tax=Acrobeloides nanus TaxID=290746 RepID=A0A914CG42_9BILA|nr:MULTISPECIES: hypothetical protein [unclassified Microbacterium]KQR94174.1 hypothetical protein ASG00_14010 [Microbacterium sp. Leaf351]KQR95725.1 hypothetical protein ASF93_14005 [Microbacterium sp. Leaf347]MBN9197020.1 hypothetical protein [Microbacterium ginsengisoli]OJU76980.1 MAG: hypothetical protein BGO15_05605 [Microbacterium sp. 71-23]
MKHYTATASRDGKWWMIRIPDLDGLTQTRRLGDAESTAREYIAATLDVAPDDIAVTVTVSDVNGLDVLAETHAISAARSDAAALERAASDRAVSLAKRLAAAEIPVRDIGTIMGVSHQRAAQLVNT